MRGIRQITAVLIAIMNSFAVCGAAQAYPEKPIEFIVPFTPGGPSDTLSRAIGAGLSKAVGQSVVINNVPGAGAVIGMVKLKRSPADGYTIGLIHTGTHAINPALLGSGMQYDPLLDFTFLTGAVKYANYLIVNANSRFKTVGDLITFAKEKPNEVSFGSAGIGTTNHLSGELLKSVSGAPMLHVPYKGSAAPMTDVIGDRLTFMFDIANTTVPQIKAGRVRALAMTGEARSPYTPEIPTMAEAGYPGASGEFWFAIAAPANLPEPIAEKLNTELVRVLRSPEMKERLTQQYLEAWPTSPDELKRVVISEMAKWAKIIKPLGLKVD